MNVKPEAVTGVSLEDRQRAFAAGLVRACKSHADWLTVVGFGLPTLLEDPEFLFGLIFDEGRRMVEATEVRPDAHAANVKRILGELGLQLTAAPVSTT